MLVGSSPKRLQESRALDPLVFITNSPAAVHCRPTSQLGSTSGSDVAHHRRRCETNTSRSVCAIRMMLKIRVCGQNFRNPQVEHFAGRHLRSVAAAERECEGTRPKLSRNEQRDRPFSREA